MDVKTAELKNRLSHYLRLAEQGESITVLVRNKPIVKLVPIRTGKQRQSDDDAAWQKERAEMLTEAKKLGIKLTIPPKRPSRVIPHPTPAPDGRTDVNTIVEMRRERDY
jgi:prevent-host-death family protein